MSPANLNRNRLRAGMVGLGMIFDETYRPLFRQLHTEGLFRRDFGLVDVELAGVASLTGRRAERIRREDMGRIADFTSFIEPDSVRSEHSHSSDNDSVTFRHNF